MNTEDDPNSAWDYPSEVEYKPSWAVVFVMTFIGGLIGAVLAVLFA
jgi:hypothetical protein